MKKIIIVVIAVFVLLILGIFAGIIPLGGLLDTGLDTVHVEYAGCTGNPGTELLDQKSYILSYKGDGFSEKIVVTGGVKRGSWSMAHIDKYKYTVYLKENEFSGYETHSKFAYGSKVTSKFITNPNPGAIPSNWGGGEGAGEIYSVPPYNFRIVGDKYSSGSIKVILQGYIDWNQANPFDEGYIWTTLSIDEAYLYSGYGGLYLPTGIIDGVQRPFSTFEVGQEVNIRVETAKGGYGSPKPWRVTLNEPYNTDWEDWENPSAGGGVVVDKSYANDVTNGRFSFTVTADMAKKSMESSEPYSIRIWNELLPKGTMYVDFLDFIALAPSNVVVSMDGVIIPPGEDTALQTKVGDICTVSLSATSDIGIDYFRISVIYGTNDVLLPSDPLSKLWLINTRNIGGSDNKECNLPQLVEFKPTYESYVSIHAKARDIEGRASPSVVVCTIWAYKDTPVPDEVIEDETGTDYYGGGQTPGYMPWDVEGGFWEEPDTPPIEINWIGVLVAFLIVIGMILVGLFVFKQPKMMIIMGVAGFIIAILVYAIFFTEMFL